MDNSQGSFNMPGAFPEMSHGIVSQFDEASYHYSDEIGFDQEMEGSNLDVQMPETSNQLAENYVEQEDANSVHIRSKLIRLSKLLKTSKGLKKKGKKKNQDVNLRNRLNARAAELSLKIDMNEAKEKNNFICTLFINGIKVTTMGGSSLSEARKAAFSDAFYKVQCSDLRIVKSDTKAFRELATGKLGSRPNQYLFRTNTFSSFPVESLDESAPENKESTITMLSNRKIGEPVESFVLLEPKKTFYGQNVQSSLLRSSTLSRMLVEFEYIFADSTTKCVLRIENTQVADVLAGNKKEAKYKACLVALKELLQKCWTIKTKETVPIAFKIQPETVITPTSCGLPPGGVRAPDAEIGQQFRQKIKSMFDDFMWSRDLDILAFDPNFKQNERKLIRKEYENYGLKAELIRRKGRSYLCVWRPYEILFEYLQSIGGENQTYKLIPPNENITSIRSVDGMIAGKKTQTEGMQSVQGNSSYQFTKNKKGKFNFV